MEEYIGNIVDTLLTVEKQPDGFYKAILKFTTKRSLDMVTWEEKEASVMFYDTVKERAIAGATHSLTHYLKAVDFDLFKNEETSGETDGDKAKKL